MIDVSKFVNSKDILRYWEEIDCIRDFTPIQLVYSTFKEIAKYLVRSVMVAHHALDVV